MYQPQTFQMPQQAAQSVSGLSGRVISNIEEINPNDVPMDGSTAFFPSQDGSAIFAKAWNRDGSIATVRYIPEIQEQKQEQSISLQDVMDTLQDIQDLLKPKRRTTKKEATDDGE